MLDYTNSSTIFVSQAAGADGLSGFSPIADDYGAGPVRTLDRALDMIWNMRFGGVMHPVTVKIMGDYFLESPLGLGCKYFSSFFDRNLPCDNITIESYEGRSKIVGGKRLTGFARDVFNGTPCVSLYIPEVKSGKWRFTDLYVNGKRALPARYPKNGTLRAVTTEAPDSDKIYCGSRWFIAHKEDLKDIKNIESCTVSFFHYWVDEHSPVESYDKETGKLTMALRSRFKITANYERNSTSELYYFLENVAQSFTEANEWYLDTENGMLYYVPEAPDADPGELEVYAPTLEQLICIKGCSDNKIHGIRLRGLDLLCTKGDYVSTADPRNLLHEGEAGFASDIQSACAAYGAISFEQAEDCSIEDCFVSCVGLHAIEIGAGCDTVRVKNCHMENLGGGGVKILGATADGPAENATKHCIIRNNLIKNIGKRFAAACGVLICHSSHNEVSDNEICYTDYTGISVGWVWGYKPSTTYGNLIKNNHVHHIGMGNLSDMAGIYLLGVQNGTAVYGNLVHDVNSAHYGGHGIYTDEGSSYIAIEKNVVYRCKSECYYQHYGAHNTIRDNIFAFGGQGLIILGRADAHVGIIVENNTLITDATPVYAVPGGGRPGALPSLRSCRNKIWDISGSAPILFSYAKGEERVSLTLDRWQSGIGKDMESVVCEPTWIEIDKANKEIRLL